jgi:hypothetical protein
MIVAFWTTILFVFRKPAGLYPLCGNGAFCCLSETLHAKAGLLRVLARKVFALSSVPNGE